MRDDGQRRAAGQVARQAFDQRGQVGAHGKEDQGGTGGGQLVQGIRARIVVARVGRGGEDDGTAVLAARDIAGQRRIGRIEAGDAGDDDGIEFAELAQVARLRPEDHGVAIVEHRDGLAGRRCRMDDVARLFFHGVDFFLWRIAPGQGAEQAVTGLVLLLAAEQLGKCFEQARDAEHDIDAAQGFLRLDGDAVRVADAGADEVQAAARARLGGIGHGSLLFKNG